MFVLQFARVSRSGVAGGCFLSLRVATCASTCATEFLSCALLLRIDSFRVMIDGGGGRFPAKTEELS
jgi:hypothetical protein